MENEIKYNRTKKEYYVIKNGKKFKINVNSKAQLDKIKSIIKQQKKMKRLKRIQNKRKISLPQNEKLSLAVQKIKDNFNQNQNLKKFGLEKIQQLLKQKNPKTRAFKNTQDYIQKMTLQNQLNQANLEQKEQREFLKTLFKAQQKVKDKIEKQVEKVEDEEQKILDEKQKIEEELIMKGDIKDNILDVTSNVLGYFGKASNFITEPLKLFNKNQKEKQVAEIRKQYLDQKLKQTQQKKNLSQSDIQQRIQSKLPQQYQKIYFNQKEQEQDQLKNQQILEDLNQSQLMGNSRLNQSMQQLRLNISQSQNEIKQQIQELEKSKSNFVGKLLSKPIDILSKTYSYLTQSKDKKDEAEMKIQQLKQQLEQQQDEQIVLEIQRQIEEQQEIQQQKEKQMQDQLQKLKEQQQKLIENIEKVQNQNENLIKQKEELSFNYQNEISQLRQDLQNAQQNESFLSQSISAIDFQPQFQPQSQLQFQQQQQQQKQNEDEEKSIEVDQELLNQPEDLYDQIQQQNQQQNQQQKDDDNKLFKDLLTEIQQDPYESVFTQPEQQQKQKPFSSTTYQQEKVQQDKLNKSMQQLQKEEQQKEQQQEQILTEEDFQNYKDQSQSFRNQQIQQQQDEEEDEQSDESVIAKRKPIKQFLQEEEEKKKQFLQKEEEKKRQREERIKQILQEEEDQIKLKREQEEQDQIRLKREQEEQDQIRLKREQEEQENPYINQQKQANKKKVLIYVNKNKQKQQQEEEEKKKQFLQKEEEQKQELKKYFENYWNELNIDQKYLNPEKKIKNDQGYQDIKNKIKQQYIDGIYQYQLEINKYQKVQPKRSISTIEKEYYQNLVKPLLEQLKQYVDNFESFQGFGKPSKDKFQSQSQFQGITKQQFANYFYKKIAPYINLPFQFNIIEPNQSIPTVKENSQIVYNICVFFFSADKQQIGKHFNVFIHDNEIDQIYFFDPLGIIQNENFQQVQQKIQQYIDKYNQDDKIFKIKINSLNAQESEYSLGTQKNDQNYCSIYTLIFIYRICVLEETFKQASNFDNLNKKEKELQTKILIENKVIEDQGKGYQFIFQ